MADERELQKAEKGNDVAPDENKGGKQKNGGKHANQFTEGRNDDRGRKE